MSEQELENCLPCSRQYYVNIPYFPVKQLLVDNQPVWKNPEVFTRDSKNPPYCGKGDITLEFRANLDRVEELVLAIHQRKLGLKFPE